MTALQVHSQHEAAASILMITVLVTASRFQVLENPRCFDGALRMAAAFSLAPLGTAQTLPPTLLHIWGTLMGSVLVIAVVAQVDSIVATYRIGVVIISIALLSRLGKHGWVYYVFMVTATASLNVTSLGQVGQLGTQRVVDNQIGGAPVLLASMHTIGDSHWASKHVRIPPSETEASALAPTPAA